MQMPSTSPCQLAILESPSQQAATRSSALKNAVTTSPILAVARPIVFLLQNNHPDQLKLLAMQYPSEADELSAYISHWLNSTIIDSSDQDMVFLGRDHQDATMPTTPSRKRKVPLHQYDGPRGVTSRDTLETDDDATPRAAMPAMPTFPPLGAAGAARAPFGRQPSAWSAGSSSVSGTSSPTKEMSALGGRPAGGIEWRQMDETEMPHRLRSLHAKLKSISRGQAVLPLECRDDLRPYLRKRQMRDVFVRESEQDGHDRDEDHDREPSTQDKQPHEEQEGDDDDDELGADAMATLPGHVPKPEIVQWLLSLAKTLNNEEHGESTWNGEIHGRLMELVFRPPPLHSFPLSHFTGRRQRANRGNDDDNDHEAGRVNDVGIDFTSTVGATVHSYYSNNTLVGKKKVDYLIYVDPEKCTTTEAISAAAGAAGAAAVPRTATSGGHDADRMRNKLSQLRDRTGTNTVNPTDYPPLSRRPMAICVETKKQGVGAQKAVLQIGVWHSCHWRFLHTLLLAAANTQGEREQGDDEDNMGYGDTEHVEEEDVAVAAQEGARREARSQNQRQTHHAPLGSDDTGSPDAVLGQLEFLPGIFVEGHDWHFVASTWDSRTQTTVVWSRVLFGSTRSVLEAYQIVTGLRLLARWASDDYWTWFRRYIL
ncbi:hypothetical protein MKZ38_009539 [Zalerion maritima]|uniref:PD-(D/E)XK nuclease-like domain-containing protein n=1 Tax=Zalerion maritima TaxID=339359 RepID=A0AAD5RFX2_9PEZI|nr:hypothetical protein MKZ38_009539 [Zalerion maritima]